MKVHPMGEWALNEACRQVAAWKNRGLLEVPVALNISPMQFLREDFSRTVAQTLGNHGVGPQCIRVELPEAAITNHMNEARPILNDLRTLGVKIDIDEFGHGNSNLKQLSQLPIHSLKVNALSTNAPLTQTLLAVGQHLGFDIIAERVETEAALDFFRERKYGKVQGFHLCRPLSGDEFANWYPARAA